MHLQTYKTANDIYVGNGKSEKVLPLGTRSNLDVTDIDCNDKDAQLCSVYAHEIYNNLRVAEVCDVDSVFSIYFLFLSFIWHFCSWSVGISGRTKRILHLLH